MLISFKINIISPHHYNNWINVSNENISADKRYERNNITV